MSADIVSRRDFLKNLPKYFLKGIQKIHSVPLYMAGESRAFASETQEIQKEIIFLDKERCLAWEGGTCQACYLACPLRDQALRIEDQRPLLVLSFCDGCACCVKACQTINDLPALRRLN